MIGFYALLFLMFMAAIGFVLFPLLCPGKKSRTSPWLAIILMLSLGILTVTLYRHWGYAPQLRAWFATSVQSSEFNKDIRHIGNAHQFIRQLKQKLLECPDDANGWYLLGLVYLSDDNYESARDAFEKAYQIDKKNPNISAQYANALYLGHRYQMTQQAQQLIDSTLRKDPYNETCLQLLALNAMRYGHYEEAIAQWQKILSHLPRDNGRRQEYQLAIQRVQKLIRIENEMKL